MAWDAVLFDFEGTLANLTVPGRRECLPYHDGRRAVPPVRDRSGREAGHYLRRVFDAGLPCAVVSASPLQAVVRWLEEQGLPKPPVVIGYHDTVLHRPSPDPLVEALHRLGVSPSARVLSLGDAADDVIAASRAGLVAGTLAAEAPVMAPPSLYLDGPDALLEDDLCYAIAGRFDADRTAVTLEAEAPGHLLRMAGRLSEEPLRSLLTAGAEGNWSPRAAELAHTLVIHALGSRPRGAVLTWLPGPTRDADPMADLVARLRSLTSLPSARLLQPADDSAGGPLALAGPRDLAGSHVLVLCALRTRGERLSAAARVLLDGGAERVTGLVLAQDERPGHSASASWGPTRIPNEDLRRLRSRQRGDLDP